MILTPYCRADDFDAATQTCSAVFWGPTSGGFLPPLETSDAIVILSSIVGLFAIAWGFKFIRKFLFK